MSSLLDVQNATALLTATNLAASLPGVPPSSSIGGRVKRRTRVHIHVDGDATPAFAQDGRDGDEQDVSVEVDAVYKTSPRRDREATATSAPSAHARSRRERTVSPRKAITPTGVSSVHEGRLMSTPGYAFSMLTG